MNLEEVKHELWRRGELKWKCGDHTSQIEIYDALRALPKDANVAVCLIARRWGKSFLACLMGLEDCLRKPGSHVFIIAPTLKHANSITAPLIRQIIMDAPAGLIRRTKSEYRWRMSNGSEFVLGSFDTAVESIRGQGADNLYFEETGFVETLDDYEYVIDSILGPTLLHSGGRMVHMTTPPKFPDHPFLNITVPQAELLGTLYVRTIEDNPLLSREQIDKAIADAGGLESITVQREYYCRVVRDSSLVVVPEYDEDRHVGEIDLPEFYHTWVAGDLGGTRDKTCGLLMAYDFEHDLTLVLAESSHSNETATSVIAGSFKVMEARSRVKPLRRWLDGSGQTMVDLRRDYDYVATLPDKQDLDAAINVLRAAFNRNKIRIHPSCTLLRATLRSGIYNKKRTDFMRTKALGHCDAIMALVYGYRMRIRSNPVPVNHGLHRETHKIKSHRELLQEQSLAKAFKVYV